MKIDEFINECKKLDINIEEIYIKKLEIYKKLLQEWNYKINLTTIIQDDDIYLKHFYDSLCISKAVKLENQELCDFGTGAGFPGLVLAIIFNNLKVTLIESNNKKITFLYEVVKLLNLSNVNIINSRVEEFGKKNRELFDIVTCRAVSNLNIILELSSSLVKVGGLFIPLKSNIKEELYDSLSNISKLSYKLVDTIKYKLPKEMSDRTLIIFKKIKKTDNKYPRNYNVIVNNYKK